MTGRGTDLRKASPMCGFAAGAPQGDRLETFGKREEQHPHCRKSCENPKRLADRGVKKVVTSHFKECD